MTRPIRARIHLDALRNNLAVARAHAPRSRVLAVIKAEAYGHGLLRAARALDAADAFALLDLEDGIRLREAGLRIRWCCWKVFSPRASWPPPRPIVSLR